MPTAPCPNPCSSEDAPFLHDCIECGRVMTSTPTARGPGADPTYRKAITTYPCAVGKNTETGLLDFVNDFLDEDILVPAFPRPVISTP
jgi:hypothetical protein